MILTDTDGKTSFNSPEHDEGVPPPPYSPLPPRSSVKPASQSLDLPPPDLAPTNYVHSNDKNDSAKRKILLDLSISRPPASALPEGRTQGKDGPHLALDSHNGTVFGEVWVLRANRVAVARERARLHFRTHNGTFKALVHVHPATVEPRPFLNIDVKVHNGTVAIAIPRCFRGQLKLRTGNGTVRLSPALAPRAATLTALDGTHTYFVGERPGSGLWHTGESEDGEEVDGLIGSSNNGDVKISYDDEDASSVSTGVLGSLFKAIGF